MNFREREKKMNDLIFIGGFGIAFGLMLVAILMGIRNAWTYDIVSQQSDFVFKYNNKLINDLTNPDNYYTHHITLEEEFPSYDKIMWQFWKWNPKKFLKKTGKLATDNQCPEIELPNAVSKLYIDGIKHYASLSFVLISVPSLILFMAHQLDVHIPFVCFLILGAVIGFSFPSRNL